jgi:hypothetical protein
MFEIADVGRDDLAQILHKLDFKTGVEVGVAAGAYSETLAKHNPQMKLWGIDPYAGYRPYRDYTLKSTFDRMRQEAYERLKPYPNYEFIYDFSMEAIKDFEDESLDFVYIDGNHQEPYVSEDINGWSRKVRPGGIVAGHDYIRLSSQGMVWQAKDAIDKYTRDNKILLFVLGTKAKIEGMKRDDARSWMFLK